MRKASLNRHRTEQEKFVRSYADLYYDAKDPSNLNVFKGQQLFLRVAAQVVPDFAESLFKATWPIITDWIQASGSLPPPSSPAYRDYCAQFMGAIRSWAKRFFIDTPWVISEMWSTPVSGILYVQKGIDPILAFGTWRRTPQPKGETRPFHLPAWDPRAERAPEYIARADAAWAEVRDAYVAETKNEITRAGLKRIPAKRNKKVPPEVRLEWAALVQCAGASIDDLADQYGVETETIRVSAARILKDLDLPPRT